MREKRGDIGRSQTLEGLIVPILIEKIHRRVCEIKIVALRKRWIDGWGEIIVSTVLCAAQDFRPSPQMCVRDIDHNVVG